MTSLNAALLINLLGFAVGIALYALLAVMVGLHRKTSRSSGVDLLLLATAFLGLLWNIGELFVFIQKDHELVGILPIMTAASYSALGFLPSVVVHSAQNEEAKTHWLTYLSYGLSMFAAVLHFHAAFSGQPTPSEVALRTLTFGSITLAAGLLIFNFRQTLEKKTIWAAALLVFAVSALHLSGDQEESSWIVELVAHQSSLTIALVILYQNYRFAFADLFLKRAISLILLTVVAFALYIFVAAPLLNYHETHDRNDVQAIGLIILLWVTTALMYPGIHRFAVWLVDKVILHRADYAKFQLELAQKIESVDSIDDILNEVTERLGKVLTAGRFSWSESGDTENQNKFALVDLAADSADIFIPTAEAPFYRANLSEFYGGRRLLSEETAMLDAVSLFTARRIDAVRVTQERFDQEFREQEFSKLAAEAQLTALRSQINPHFLFNALTTIGYLINSSPDKAMETLLHLTKLLRGVLNSTAEFSSLADELKLIESYLDIERARFEERLQVKIDVSEDLGSIQIPSLIIQPLVENAIKHGISENINGGSIHISAELQRTSENSSLRLVVSDTGSGRATKKSGDIKGVGLTNIRSRLAAYYGAAASLSIEKSGDGGTTATILLPVKSER